MHPFAATIVELAGHGLGWLAQVAILAIGRIKAPLMGLGNVQAKGRPSMWVVGLSASNSSRFGETLH